jgi:rhodanese-related sulfurtransferase
MSEQMKTIAVAAVAAGIGFVVGQKMAKSKGPEGFGARVGQEAAKVRSLSPAEVKTMIGSTANVTIIDVRDSADASADAIKGAINIPLSNLVFAADQGFVLPVDVKVKGEVKVPKGTAFCHEALKGDKSKPILVSCGLGGQALIGAGMLADYGFTNVMAVEGGNLAWMDADGETCPCSNISK